MASWIFKIADMASGFLYQGPRYRKFGPNSGEEFRDDFLIPFLENLNPKEEGGAVDFSGTEAFSPSFLEEAFGGAVRRGYGDKVERLTYINIPEKWKRVLKRYVADALSWQPGFEGGRVMDDTVYLIPEDLVPVRFAFDFTCPYCGSKERACSDSIIFHEQFECPHCGKMVDVDCNVW